ncbi:transcriptional regulator [Bradyrhizobium sp. SSBR45G]|uniref:LysR family transcriptional regulator n=1 Tax=unclassified Bradyrhizobium TaxID=2631580 RepID=UPI002342AFFC|nr:MULTISPECIES: LysR family transcriptional regulator [unclassified Bradyrhizobium]GLH78964.1 transcriptional regulator [Bradyrhizobium sp. SSBR45G]GLH85287.1 transcriptional regulator [Bradyrhizobium sp. SSBR45R]
MDIRELRYFSAVFEERSLTRAAARCFVSQPSISLAIANLETELGTGLFIRHRKGVVPLEAAERLQPIARRIVDEADAARNLFRQGAPKQVLKLGLMRTLDGRRVTALLKPLTARQDLKLHIVGPSERADARVVARSLIRDDEHFLPLWSERYVAALPLAHPLTLKPRLRAADFADVAMIDRCHCENGALAGRKPREVAAIAETEDWALALVAAGVGVAIVPEGVVHGRSDIAVRNIDMTLKRQVGLAYTASRPPSEVLETLIATLRAAAPKKPRTAAGRQKRAPAKPARHRIKRTQG